MPIDKKINEIRDVPYTLSFVMRKRMQLDNINELPKEKRPADDLIWEGSSEELDAFFDRVFKGKENQTAEIVFSDSEIER